MSWTVFNDAARSADQSRAVNERRALIDRLIATQILSTGVSAATRGSPFTCSYVAGPGKRNTIAAGPAIREGDWALLQTKRPRPSGFPDCAYPRPLLRQNMLPVHCRGMS